jgi:hypothetical protein
MTHEQIFYAVNKLRAMGFLTAEEHTELMLRLDEIVLEEMLRNDYIMGR